MIPIEKGLPAAGQNVIVVCRQFRLLGYRDEKGGRASGEKHGGRLRI